MGVGWGGINGKGSRSIPDPRKGLYALDLKAGVDMSLQWFCLPDSGNFPFSLVFFYIVIICFASKFMSPFLVITY